jgi:MAC/Perforin domain
MRSERVRILANEYLGVTYDPVCGVFGRACVLKLGSADVGIDEHPGSQSEQFVRVNDIKEDRTLVATRLRVDFEMRDVVSLNAHYSTSKDFKVALSSKSQLYLSQHITAVAKIACLSPQLSEEMITEINQLPQWSESSDESKQQYYDFFASHGTHVVLRVALGGVLRVIAQTDTNMEENTHGKDFGAMVQVPGLNQINLNVGGSIQGSWNHQNRRSNEQHNVKIFRDGGGAVTRQLTRVLEQQFSHLQDPSRSPTLSDWTEVRTQWIDDIKKDPVFCPDDSNMEYRWLYTLKGPTDLQKRNLKLASKSYLAARQGQGSSVRSPTLANDLPRKENRNTVSEMLKQALGMFSKQKLNKRSPIYTSS